MTRPRASLFRRLFLASAAASATACTSLHVEEGPGPTGRTLPGGGRGDEIVLTLKDGREVRMFYPTIVGDSVVGTPTSAVDNDTPHITVAKADIARVAVWRTDAGKTAAAVVAGTAAAATLIVLAACASIANGG